MHEEEAKLTIHFQIYSRVSKVSMTFNFKLMSHIHDVCSQTRTTVQLITEDFTFVVGYM